MATLAGTDYTVTILSTRRIAPAQKEVIAKLVFGDSSKLYPAGGMPQPTAAQLGFSTPIRSISIDQNRNTTTGTHWNWDQTNSVFHGWHQGYTPYIIVEEAVTLTSNAGTLKYPPAHIISAVGTISAVIQPLRPIPTGITPATKQFAVNFTTGGVVTLGSDSVTSMAVTYIPQQPAGPFSAANMIVDEVVAAVTGNVNLANRAATIAYLYQTTATAARLPIAHVNASGVVAVDIQNAGATTISFNSAQNAKSVSVTYLKYAGFQQPGIEWVDQASIALTSQAKEFGQAAGERKAGIVIPGFSGQIVGKEGSNYLSIYLGDSTPTPAVSIASFTMSTDKIVTAETTAQTSIEDTPLLFLSNFYTPYHGLAELTVNHAPAATTLVIRAIG